MTKQFTLVQLYGAVTGILSTTMDDIYDILNHVCDTDLMTHHLPIATDYLLLKNPEWVQQVKNCIQIVETTVSTVKIEQIIHIKNNMNNIYDIPQLKDEFDTSDFTNYMITNSLLLRKG